MPRFGRGRSHDAPPATSGQRSEVCRVVRANVLVALGELESSTVMVSSALPSEGKTATCANLAVSLAAAGRRIIPGDVDLRHPTLPAALGAHNEFGLTEVL